MYICVDVNPPNSFIQLITCVRLPEENDPDEANLRDMAEMFKQITHPDLYNKNVAGKNINILPCSEN